MFAKLFGPRATTKADVGIAIVGAILALWKAYDTSKTYKIEHEIKEITS